MDLFISSKIVKIYVQLLFKPYYAKTNEILQHIYASDLTRKTYNFVDFLYFQIRGTRRL